MCAGGPSPKNCRMTRRIASDAILSVCQDRYSYRSINHPTVRVERHIHGLDPTYTRIRQPRARRLVRFGTLTYRNYHFTLSPQQQKPLQTGSGSALTVVASRRPQAVHRTSPGYSGIRVVLGTSPGQGSCTPRVLIQLPRVPYQPRG